MTMLDRFIDYVKGQNPNIDLSQLKIDFLNHARNVAAIEEEYFDKQPEAHGSQS